MIQWFFISGYVLQNMLQVSFGKTFQNLSYFDQSVAYVILFPSSEFFFFCVCGWTKMGFDFGFFLLSTFYSFDTMLSLLLLCWCVDAGDVASSESNARFYENQGDAQRTVRRGFDIVNKSKRGKSRLCVCVYIVCLFCLILAAFYMSLFAIARL